MGKRWRWAEGMAFAVLAALAATQGPLFYSNQNQYLLHGLKDAGWGHLRYDWLANTQDPTPVFSAGVAALYRLGGLDALHLAHFALMVVYFLSLYGWVRAAVRLPDTASLRWTWYGLLILTHAAAIRILSVWLFGKDYPWYFQCGVANQYVLGPGLQPSVSGVLLVSGVAAFAAGCPRTAAILTALPCVVHPTYLLPATLLMIGYGVALLWRHPHGGPVAFHMMLLAAGLMVPVAIFVLFQFGPTDTTIFTEAQRILVEHRIPHHALIERWFDWPDAVQIVGVVAAVALVRPSPVRLACGVTAGLAVALSLVQYATGSYSLALLFPWRVSAVLVPLATAAWAAWAAYWLARWVPGRIAGVVVSVSLAVAGSYIMWAGYGYRMNVEEEGLLQFVREHASPQDMYLLPIRIPEVRKGRGTGSTSFTPPPRPRPGSSLIPVDLQRFRLATGAAIYVDFKSIPYRDVEVIEWWRRLRQCENWYAGGWDQPSRREELRAAGITHLVSLADQPIVADYLTAVYRDAAYVVYRIE